MNDPQPTPTAPTESALPRYRPGIKYVLMLGAIAAIPAITTDIYLPSLTDVRDELATTDAMVALTMSGMLIGGAVGQLMWGPLTDRYGRKAPLLVGLALHIITSLLCAIAPNITILVALRIMQGFFNAACAVAAISVIRDRFVGATAARLLSQLMLVIGVAPLFAPSVGGAIASFGSWRTVFLALAIIGAIMAVIVARFLPETLAEDHRLTGGVGRVAKGYWTLAKDRKFLALAMLPALAMTTIFAYVVGSPFVFQEHYGLSTSQYAVLFAMNGLAMVFSAQLNASLVRKLSPESLLRVGLGLQLVLALALVLWGATGWGGFWTFEVTLWLLLGCQGLIGANAQVLALANYGHMVGTAAAVLGSLQSGVAGAVSPMVGVFGGDALAMAAVIAAGLILANLIVVFGTDLTQAGRKARARTTLQRAIKEREIGDSTHG